MDFNKGNKLTASAHAIIVVLVMVVVGVVYTFEPKRD